MPVLQVIGVEKCKKRVMTKYLSSLVITLLITNQLVHYQLVKCKSDEWWRINQNIGFYTWVCFSVYHTFQWLVGMSDLYCSKVIGAILTYIIHSGFISGYQNRYGDNLKPPTNVYHRMTAWCRVIILSEALISACSGLIITSIFMERIWLISPITESDSGWFQIIPLVRQRVSSRLATKLQGVDGVGKSWTL